MSIQRINSFKTLSSQYFQQKNNVQKSSTYVMNPFNKLSADTVSFSGNNKVEESLIVDDIKNYDRSEYDFTKFSDKLRRDIAGTNLTITTQNGIKHYSLSTTEGREIKIDVDKNKIEKGEIVPGFILGKTGVYATLTVNPKSKDSFKILIPENASLETKNGIKAKVVKHENKKNPSFTGDCSVNVYYKRNETEEAVDNFINLSKDKNSKLFNKIKTSDIDYSEEFHPYVLAGGFGSRLEAITHYHNNNKPSAATPIKDWHLLDFSLLNLYQANLINNDTNIKYHIQARANGPVGCFITNMGYDIVNDKKGIHLANRGKSELPTEKNIIVMPADNITDIDLADALETFKNTPDAGFMVVGVPDERCYCGKIVPEENSNDIKEFIPNKTHDDVIDKTTGTVKDKNGNDVVLGNAFIYVIKPDILDTIADIYDTKIQERADEILAKRRGQSNSKGKLLTDAEYSKAVDLHWDREIIPKLVEMSKNGELKDKEGNPLKTIVYKATETTWADVGEYASYYNTMKNLTKDDMFSNMPQSIKDAARENVEDNVIFNNPNAKEVFNRFLGDGTTTGNIIVI